MKKFKGADKEALHKGVVINSDILTAGIWPEQNTHAVILPSLIKDC